METYTALVRNFEGQPVNMFNESEGLLFEAQQTAERLGYRDARSAVVGHAESRYLVKREVTRKSSNRFVTFDKEGTVWYLTQPGLYDLILASTKSRSRPLRGCLKTYQTSQPMYHQMNHRHTDHGLARLGAILIILC